MGSGNTYTSTLQFSPLRESHAGMYTCRLGGNARLASSTTITVNRMCYITVMSLFYVHQSSLSPGPSISVMVTANGAPELGQNGYSLTCGVSGAGNLSPTITYRWTRDNGTQTQVGTNSNTLSFSPLRLTDVGRYTCEVTISSLFLNSDITMPSSDS